jgi:hypothetical protein
MKKLIVLIGILFISISIMAQTTCITATHVIPGYTTSYPAGVNAGSAQSGPNYGCLYSQPNPAWFYGSLAQTGNVTLNLHSNPQVDVDFIVWGPFTDSLINTCNQLDSQHIISCSYSTSWNESIQINNVTSNSYYIFLFTNYSNQPCNIYFTLLDSTFVQDTLYSTIDSCLTTMTIDSSYINNVFTNDSGTYVSWVLIMAGDTTYIDQPYQIDSAGTYLFTLTINCAKSTTTVSAIYVVTQEDLDILVDDGIPTTYLNSDVQLYPNPVSDVLNISSKKEIYNITLMNNLGKEILNTNKNYINTNSLSNGVYFVKITFTDKTTSINKIVK